MPGDTFNRLLHPIKIEADLNDLSQSGSTNGDDLHAESILQEDSECIIPQFETNNELQMINPLGNGIGMLSPTTLSPNMGFLLEHNEDVDSEENILMQHMDIRQPLSTLKTLLEHRLGLALDDYQFWLQDAQMLEAHKNLVDQCVQGKGLVQVNVQIRTITKKINIVDVLKPHDEYTENHEGETGDDNTNEGANVGESSANNEQEMECEGDGEAVPGDQTNVIKWVVDSQFKKDQERLRIPEDPAVWSVAHVRHWLQWAVRQFHLANVKLNDWNIPGISLCEMTHREFQQKVPSDPGNVFWTHVELLRKCKFVAVLQKDTTEAEQLLAIIRKPHKNIMKPKVPLKILGHNNQEFVASAGNRSGNNGQIQLWQFLLDILTDKTYKHAIQWIGNEGEFKLNNPEYVARLWGSKKNKPTMNYEKLSRALRYYYDGDMISKVHGKRFVYKFVCDLKQVLGYDAGELSKLVSQCATTAPSNEQYVWQL